MQIVSVRFTFKKGYEMSVNSREASNRTHKRIWVLVSVILFLCVFLISLTIGRFPFTISEFISTIISPLRGFQEELNPQLSLVIFQIRLPRILMVSLVGAGLSVAGACYQSLFQNPMMSPDILGASQGAAFGAAVALIFGLSYGQIVGSSFVFGVCAVFCVLLLNRLVRSPGNITLILIGMMIGTLFSSGISLLKLMGDPTNTLPAITFWLMGSFASMRMVNVLYTAPIIVLGLIPIFLLRWQLNVVSLGVEEASSLGVNVKRLRLILITCATIVTAACVSITGLIGWVGLIVPHMARLIFGQDHRYSVFGTALMGATFLLIIDNIARMLTTSEVPIGILTAFIGAPVFLGLLLRKNRVWK